MIIQIQDSIIWTHITKDMEVMIKDHGDGGQDTHSMDMEDMEDTHNMVAMPTLGDINTILGQDSTTIGRPLMPTHTIIIIQNIRILLLHQKNQNREVRRRQRKRVNRNLILITTMLLQYITTHMVTTQCRSQLMKLLTTQLILTIQNHTITTLVEHGITLTTMRLHLSIILELSLIMVMHSTVKTTIHKPISMLDSGIFNTMSHI